MKAKVSPADRDIVEAREAVGRGIGVRAAGGLVPFPDDLVLVPVSRWPTTLPAESLRAVLDTPVDQRVRQHETTDDALPHVSIVVVTLDGLAFSRLCLESLLANPSSVHFEVIVVDNGSTDGTGKYLRELARRDGRVRVQFNGRNIGFAAATNRGVALTRGGVLVFLNNDTIVPGGTLEALADYVAAPRIGLLGVVTNRAGNEAQIEVPYRTYGELGRFARDYMRTHSDQAFDIRTVTMFCAALRREVWSKIGPLDERFELGLFEDDDYAMRVRHAGYRVVCAEGIFVHHFGQASIGRLGPAGEYGALYHANRSRWEAKWNISWQPHERREKAGYRDFVERVRRIVCEVVPPEATVLVISKGDEELLKLGGRRAWHFPQCEDGTYAGHYPADSVTCIAELERLRAKGAKYLVIPATVMWWLEHYEGFARHLEDRCRTVLRTSECALVMFGATSAEASDAMADGDSIGEER